MNLNNKSIYLTPLNKIIIISILILNICAHIQAHIYLKNSNT